MFEQVSQSSKPTRETTILQSPYQEQLPGVLVGYLKFSPYAERNCQRACQLTGSSFFSFILSSVRSAVQSHLVHHFFHWKSHIQLFKVAACFEVWVIRFLSNLPVLRTLVHILEDKQFAWEKSYIL